jgi:hypothetical protein
MGGRADIVSAGSSSKDLMRLNGTALAFPGGLGVGTADEGRGMKTRDGRDEVGEIGGVRTPTACVSLLMSEKGARVWSILRCFRGGVLQYGGGGRAGGAGVASTGTPTGKAAGVRGLLRDGMLKRITRKCCASVEGCGVLVGRAMRTMEAKWTFFNVKCGHISARDQMAGKGVAISEVWHVHQRAVKPCVRTR